MFPSWLLSCWKYIKFSIGLDHRNYSYTLLKTMLQGNNVILSTHHELSLFLPIITMQYYIIEDKVYVKMNSDYFNELLNDSSTRNYITNDIKQVILLKSKAESKTNQLSPDLICITSLLSHLKGLKTVCNQEVDRYKKERSYIIENEVLESLKVCPWIEILHIGCSETQFMEYFLGLKKTTLKKVKDFKNLPSFVEKAQPSWPHLDYVDSCIFYESLEETGWFLIHGILKKALMEDMNQAMVIDYAKLKNSKCLQLFKDSLSAIPLSHAKVIFEEGLYARNGTILINFDAIRENELEQNADALFKDHQMAIKKLVEDPKYQVYFNLDDMGIRRGKFVPITKKCNWFKRVKINIRSDSIETFLDPFCKNIDEIETVQFHLGMQFTGIFDEDQVERSLPVIKIPIKFFDLNILGRCVSDVSENELSHEIYDFNVVLGRFSKIKELRIRFESYHNFFTTIKMEFLKSMTTIETLIFEYPSDDHKKAFRFFEHLDQYKPPNAKCFIVITSGRIQGPLTFEKVEMLTQKGWKILPPNKDCQSYIQAKHFKRFNCSSQRWFHLMGQCSPTNHY